MLSRTRRVTAAVAGAAAISLLAACSSSGSSSSPPAGGTTSSASASASASASVLAGGKSCSSSATPVMFWAWVPGISRAVNEFNKTHPDICVTLAAAAVLGLSELLGRKPRQLSGGQRQRVAMGRAIVREPSVFLMDEPLSNLDAKLRVQMRSEVLRVHRSLQAATLYVTHDQTEAMTMGDRVAVLQGGVLQQYDTPRALYERPANVFVATFIGSPAMNLYEAGLSASGASEGLGSSGDFAGSGDPGVFGGRLMVMLGSQRLDLPAQVAARVAAYQGRKVVVGVRPEDLVVPGQASGAASAGGAGGASAGPGAAGPGAAASGLVAEVRLVEVLGSEQHVYFSIDATQAALAASSAATGESAEAGILAASVPNGVARLDPRVGVRAGQRVTFSVDPARLHFFDPDTGNAIAGTASG